MKKLIILSLLLLITGCTSKLTCTKVQEEEYVTMNQIMTINFKGKKVDTAEFVIDALIKDNYTSSKTFFTDLLMNQFSSYKNTYGVELSVKETEKGAKLIMNMKKYSFEGLYANGNSNIKKDNVIKQFQDNGYVCN